MTWVFYPKIIYGTVCQTRLWVKNKNQAEGPQPTDHWLNTSNETKEIDLKLPPIGPNWHQMRQSGYF